MRDNEGEEVSLEHRSRQPKSETVRMTVERKRADVNKQPRQAVSCSAIARLARLNFESTSFALTHLTFLVTRITLELFAYRASRDMRP